MKKVYIILIQLLSLLLFTACAGGYGNGISESETEESLSLPEKGLLLEKEEKPEVAEGFSIYRYEGGYIEIRVKDDGRKYLIVPKNEEIPETEGDMIIIQQPLKNIYLAASQVMSQFDAIGEVGRISFSGVEEDEWKIQSAIDACKSGQIEYCGNYASPDYEYLASEGCDLAIENLMVLHKSEVIEKLEALEIPVFIDRSSSEEEPLGRTEWIKVYGILTGNEEAAEKAFSEQKAYIEELKGLEGSGKTVACFYISSQGLVVVPKSDSSLARMIEMAGGEYIFQELMDETARSNVKMSMEEFLSTAKDADIILYDGAIMPLSGIGDLIDRSRILSEFRAVKERQVWYMGDSLYQNVSNIGKIEHEIRMMLDDEDNGVYIKKLNE